MLHAVFVMLEGLQLGAPLRASAEKAKRQKLTASGLLTAADPRSWTMASGPILSFLLILFLSLPLQRNTSL